MWQRRPHLRRRPQAPHRWWLTVRRRCRPPWACGMQKAVVVALGLGAAVWTAAVQVGPPRAACGVTAPASRCHPARRRAAACCSARTGTARCRGAIGRAAPACTVHRHGAAAPLTPRRPLRPPPTACPASPPPSDDHVCAHLAAAPAAWHDEADVLGVRVRVFFFDPAEGRRPARLRGSPVAHPAWQRCRAAGTRGPAPGLARWRPAGAARRRAVPWRRAAVPGLQGWRRPPASPGALACAVAGGRDAAVHHQRHGGVWPEPEAHRRAVAWRQPAVPVRPRRGGAGMPGQPHRRRPPLLARAAPPSARLSWRRFCEPRLRSLPGLATSTAAAAAAGTAPVA